MAKHPSNHYRSWTPAEVKLLRGLARVRTPAKAIGRRLKRTVFAVYSKAKLEGIVLASVRARRRP
jgi:hypothetical protein